MNNALQKITIWSRFNSQILNYHFTKTEKKQKEKKNLFSSAIQRAIRKPLEKSVQKPAGERVVDYAMFATT